MDKINYYLYHIPGKKIGVTRDLISRVVDQQGYRLRRSRSSRTKYRY